MRLKTLDLFSGVGGNSLALYDVVDTVAYCEFDKHARAVLLSRMADGGLKPAPIYEDITKMTGKEFEGTRIDMIVAGFP